MGFHITTFSPTANRRLELITTIRRQTRTSSSRGFPFEGYPVLPQQYFVFCIRGLQLYTHRKVGGFAPKKFTFCGDRAVTASEISSLASRLPLWHFLTSYVSFFCVWRINRKICFFCVNSSWLPVSHKALVLPTVVLFRNVTPKDGRAKAQAVGRLLLTAEIRVHAEVSPYGIFGSETGFLSESFGFPLSVSSIAAPYSLVYHLEDGKWTR
jgi:hypothetical protein